MEVKKFQSGEEFVQESVEFVLQICRAKSDVVRIALSGGSTPRPVYEAIGRAFAHEGATATRRIEFYQVDERYVPVTNPASNQKMIREALISPLGEKIKFFCFDTTLSLEESVARYGQIIEKTSPDFFDLVILGIGSDGHIASLFPHSDALREMSQFSIHTMTDVFDVRDRLTLTLPPILKSRNILVLMKGAEKKSILEKFQDSGISFEDFPAKKLLEQPATTIYFWE